MFSRSFNVFITFLCLAFVFFAFSPQTIIADGGGGPPNPGLDTIVDTVSGGGGSQSAEPMEEPLPLVTEVVLTIVEILY
ncbi:MAG: hypothetical protein KAR42_11995 [candidate division Zixibacteria bacterium]|nr:hypothetical protein [candidate division Zixibacteria bacterium]